MESMFRSLAVVRNDNFVFLDITEKAKEVFSSGLFELYILHKDNSESLVEDYAQINDALDCGLIIAIEVGQI